MKILTKNNWRDGYLDYYGHPQEYRIKIQAIKNLERLADVYVVRPKSLRMVWNYLLRFGPIAVWRKIKSRLSEEARNDKFVSVGLGTIVESPESSSFAPGSGIVFILPCHPSALERAVLPSELIKVSPKQSKLATGQASIKYQVSGDDKILHIPLNENGNEKWWAAISGWSSYSGINLDKELCGKMLDRATEVIARADWDKAMELKVPKSDIREHKNLKHLGRRTSGRKPKAVLFGLGNYAKVQIVPNIKKYIELVGIHEIDPTQIPTNINVPIIDSAPYPRINEDYDALFIAGYHHTHAPIAIEALSKNKHAVAEKPIAVDRKQLEGLCNAIEKSKGSFFAGFHKRYSPFNELVLKDLLGTKNGDPFDYAKDKPINYHCIAYEVPYPKLNWYNWPNSKGPITANGCHWIDHFLFLNNWSKPKRLELFLTPDMTTNSSIELENGAVFTMTLTERGSPYIGVQDYVELRAGDKTAKIIDDSRYIAEGPNGIIRKKTINKMKNYRLMYETISKKIAEGGKGDSLESVKVSTEAMLDLEEGFQKQYQNL